MALLTRVSAVPEMVRYSNANMVREAARNNKSALLSQLLIIQYDRSIVDDTDQSGRTALMWCSQRGHFTCVKLLLEYGANTNLINQYGYTALMLASLRGHLKCVEILLQYGSDLTIRNNEGLTALDCTKSEEIRRLLLMYEFRSTSLL